MPRVKKSLHILRTLLKEGYNQSEIDLLFNTIVLSNINYALSVYAASESDLTSVQCSLDRCFKRKYTSKPVTVYDFLERQDREILRKVSNAKGHPLLSIMPRVKPSSYNLRKESCFKPKINTMRFKNSFINRLVFKYELVQFKQLQVNPPPPTTKAKKFRSFNGIPTCYYRLISEHNLPSREKS